MASSISPTLISRDVPIRFSYPDPRPLIFSKYRYQVSIRYSDTLTNIFLDNTAALRKEDLHPSCSLIVFFCWNKVYTFICLFLILHMLLQHWPTTFLVLAGESVALHCDSRPSCTASWSVCETQPTLGTSISSTVFFTFRKIRKITFPHDFVTFGSKLEHRLRRK